MNNELLEKAKTAQTPGELWSLAKENNAEITMDSAKAYFDLLHPKAAELADEELENISGGACHGVNGKFIVTSLHTCDKFSCTQCRRDHKNGNRDELCRRDEHCPNCYYGESVGAILYCEEPGNCKW